MKLLTKEIARKLPSIRATENQGMQAIAQVKFFSPWSDWTWYGVEYDPASKTFYGMVDGFAREMGLFELGELESVTGPFGLKIERDMYFEPTKLSELLSGHRS